MKRDIKNTCVADKVLINNNLRELNSKVMRSAEFRWGSTFTAKHQKRIEKELSIIAKTDCSNYFLVANDIVSAIRTGGGRIGPGRGVCGSSAVCYALGITDVDPLKYGLLFERFLHEKLKHPRSILIDVDAKGEEIAKKYLDSQFEWYKNEIETAIGPQIIDIKGVGEFGITRIPEMDFISSTLDWMNTLGRNWRDAFDEIDVEVDLFNNEPHKICYQEDLMILGQNAGMTESESDEFRKMLVQRMDGAVKWKQMFNDEMWCEMWNKSGELWMKAHCVCYEKLKRQVSLAMAMRCGWESK